MQLIQDQTTKGRAKTDENSGIQTEESAKSRAVRWVCSRVSQGLDLLRALNIAERAMLTVKKSKYLNERKVLAE